MLPSAPELCRQLASLLRPHVGPATALVGIHTGGAWIAEWLHRELGVTLPLGTINAAFYRDDYSQRGLHAGRERSAIPFEVGEVDIVIVDDVLHTGRTVRAAMNELFDYGRPRRIELAVLVDRGGRELPFASTYCAHQLSLPATQSLDLERDGDGAFKFTVVEK